MSDKNGKINTDYDLICVGGGIMSATLALMAKIIAPELKIRIYERLDKVAEESSAAWNNAGTGHSALCELNYTPPNEDGSVSINKAIEICTQFEISKQFWSFLVAKDFIESPRDFIHPVPHHSWVRGSKNADYLEKRFEAMRQHYMIDSIEFTRSIEKMKEWFPLIAKGRDEDEVMAASRIGRGTELNFAVLTRELFKILEEEYDTPVYCSHEVRDIDPDEGVEWTVEVKNMETKEVEKLDAQHVFIGAGGGSLLLLEKVEIEAKDGYGGFPVSGEWLVCKNRDVIEQHHAKVYSKAGIGDPPMSVPHLDTRYINGKRELLFGPFAGFSPKFLKEGSNLDLFKSIKFKNMRSMLGAFWHNLPLSKYLIKQLVMSFDDRMDDLRQFVKDAKNEDWEIRVAGQRVQIIKKDEYQGGKLEFGTEVVSNPNGRISCLLGASPGASTSVKIMLDVLQQAFPEKLDTGHGREILDEMVPAWNKPMSKDLFERNLKRTSRLLDLEADYS